MKPGRFYQLLLVFMCMTLCACSSHNFEQYSKNVPEINVQSYFNGKLTAHGIVKKRNSRVIRYFNADIYASWDENGIGTLNETFYFDDGERQNRVWSLIPQDDGTYLASANDTIGKAVLKPYGNSLHMTYLLEVPYKDGDITLKIDDRMFLVNQKVVINESRMSKFGIDVGSITLTIIKE